MDFDKTSIQQLFRLMKFEFKAKDGLKCQTGEVYLKKKIIIHVSFPFLVLQM